MKKIFLSFGLVITSLFIINGCGGGVADAINDALKNGFFAKTDINKTIADNSSVTVLMKADTEYTTLTKLNYITLYLKHYRIGDLKIELFSPAGTKVVLSNYRGGSREVNGITFKDDGKKSIINYKEIDTSYKPEEPLSNFNGENPKGTWRLKITDSVNNSQTGEITGYIFFINGQK